MTQDAVTLVEVGPRDGLQNESQVISTHDKLHYIDLLIKAGLKNIEIGSFVRPDRLPQMADTAQICEALFKKYNKSDYRFMTLVPNEKGHEASLQCEVKDIALFTAVSETFNQKNINCSVEDSLVKMHTICKKAKRLKQWVRVYISTAFECPYEGEVCLEDLAECVDKVVEMNPDQIVLGDTNGVATPSHVEACLEKVLEMIPKEKLGLHFHDTYGMGVANTYIGLKMGIRNFDASSAGLGGCPYAKGASGNVATEDLWYLCNREGFSSGIDMDGLYKASQFILKGLRKESNSKNVLRLSKRNHLD